MAEKSVCTFEWKIESISKWHWLFIEEHIESPSFQVDFLESTKWHLELYPVEDYISLYLCREDDSTGPDFIEVDFNFVIRGKNGTDFPNVLHTYLFKKGETLGSSLFADAIKVFIKERDAYLPEDTLTLNCTISSTTATTVQVRHFYARTVITAYRKTLVWKIDKFSSLEHGVKINLKPAFFDFDIFYKKNVENLLIVVKSFDERMKYFSFKTLIINLEGEKKDCGMSEYFTDHFKKGTLLSTLKFPEKMNRNSQYLPNDVLSLECEYGYLIQANQTDYFDVRDDRRTVGRVKRQTSSLIDALKSMYIDAIFSDIEIRTRTKTFKVHKCILTARSSVFKTMFSTDMREKSSGQVDIKDFEAVTVDQMLLFMYTDFLEDLKFASATDLYRAAHIYDIVPLKERCSYFLKDALSPATACFILIFADLHQDEDLKTAAKAYIVGNVEVFRSTEWKNFMTENTEWAMDILFWKVVNIGKVYPCNV